MSNTNTNTGITFENLFKSNQKTNKSDELNRSLLKNINSLNNKITSSSINTQPQQILNPVGQYGFQLPYYIQHNPYQVIGNNINPHNYISNISNPYQIYNNNINQFDNINIYNNINHNPIQVEAKKDYSDLDVLLGKKTKSNITNITNINDIYNINDRPDQTEENKPINISENLVQFDYNKVEYLTHKSYKNHSFDDLSLFIKDKFINYLKFKTGQSYNQYIDKCLSLCKSKDDFSIVESHLNTLFSRPDSKKASFYLKSWDNHKLPKVKNTIYKENNSQFSNNIEKRKEKYEQERLIFELNKEKSERSRNSNSNNYVVNKAFVGLCTNLEKPFFRLKDIPDPIDVRPQYILQQSLKLMIKKWNEKADYIYIEEQFKSIRQDITIQSIRNEFTVEVYEENARIALDVLDLDQFNQCQSQLIKLYSEGIKGNSKEFLAYRILYTALVRPKYVVEDLMKEVYDNINQNKDIIDSQEISHALEFMVNMNLFNYKKIFSLYTIAPNKGRLLIKPFLNRLRIKYLEVLSIGYIINISIDKILNILLFDNEKEGREFLIKNKFRITDDEQMFKCKENLDLGNFLSAVDLEVRFAYD